MSILSFASVWVLLVASCFALRPFETVPDAIANEWTAKRPANPDDLIHLKIAVTNAKDAAFEEHATKIATPYSGYYRKHLTLAELGEWVKPASENVDQIQQWLSEHNIDSEQSHDLILASMLISKAQTLLNTTYYEYHHRDGHVTQRTPEYYVPEHLAGLVELIDPTVNFPHERISRQKRSEMLSHEARDVVSSSDLTAPANDPCNATASTPACLNYLYNATYTASYSSNITMADVESYGSQIYMPNLEQYLKTYNPLPLKRNPYVTAVAVSGKNGPASATDIFDQFLQLIMGHGSTLRGQSVGLNGLIGQFEWGPGTTNGNSTAQQQKDGEQGFVDYLHNLAHADGVPSVVSQSQWVQESMLSAKYMQYLCKVFSQTSARGISFLQQVGDYGSSALPNKHGKIVFEAAFPSTCPWVSGVGVTVWDRQDSTEKAVTWQTRNLQSPRMKTVSSGLFSQTFPRPSWQNASVSAYVAKSKLEQMYGKSNPNVTGFVGTGRALPDFSVLGARIPTVQRGKVVVDTTVSTAHRSQQTSSDV